MAVKNKGIKLKLKYFNDIGNGKGSYCRVYLDRKTKSILLNYI